jgi:hypothetical protein
MFSAELVHIIVQMVGQCISLQFLLLYLNLDTVGVIALLQEPLLVVFWVEELQLQFQRKMLGVGQFLWVQFLVVVQHKQVAIDNSIF